MLGGESIGTIYLATGTTDMRKSMDALVAIVQLQFRMDPFVPGMFVFCNRGRNKLNILRWDHNGWWLYYRRLERGTFHWPSSGVEVTELSYREFRWLLDGLAPIQKQAHKPSTARIVI
jgi:transposase